jgi:predicted lipid-binding transport protein (Tim44 family)
VGTGGGFPIDLILFGMIAAFLVLRLRSILGRRQGFERPVDRPGDPRTVAPGPNLRVVPRGPTIDAVIEPPTARVLPDPASPAGQALTAMRGVESTFDPARFLDGAEAAFRMIVAAFASGNREALRPLLSDETYAAFDSAISGRETAGEVQRTEIRAITATTIESAELQGGTALIGVRFVSDQINVTMDREGLPVAGADAVMEIVDLWSFERVLGTANPVWRLMAARSA